MVFLLYKAFAFLSNSIRKAEQQPFRFGKHLTSVTLYNHFKAIVTQMGLPEVRFHDLRHTYATLALQNGVDVKTVSNNLGHATVAFTMDKYVHVSMTMQQDCVSKMESYIASL